MFSKEEILFVQTRNLDVLEIVESWANLNNLKIFCGRPHSTDILAVPFCLAVVDCKFLDFETWKTYTCRRGESSDPTRCIVIWYDESLVERGYIDSDDEYIIYVEWGDKRWRKKLAAELDIGIIRVRGA